MRLIVLFFLFAACALALSEFYVNTDSTAGGDGLSNATANDVNGHRAFATLREAIEHPNLDVADARNIYCSGSIEDTLPVTQTHWNSISTTAATKLRIIGNNTTGKWNPLAYRRRITSGNGIYNNQPGHVWLEYLQTDISGAGTVTCYRLATANVGQGHNDCDTRFIGCIAKGDGTVGQNGFYDSTFDAGSSGVNYRISCIAYNLGTGFGAADGNAINIGCTGFGNTTGDFVDPQVCIGCLGGSESSDFNFNNVGAGGGLSDYNASFDTTAVGAHKQISRTFTFADKAGRDLHLAPNDLGAKDLGVANVNRTLDVDGQTIIDGLPDIGADEYRPAGGIQTLSTTTLRIAP